MDNLAEVVVQYARAGLEPSCWASMGESGRAAAMMALERNGLSHVAKNWKTWDSAHPERPDGHKYEHGGSKEVTAEHIAAAKEAMKKGNLKVGDTYKDNNVPKEVKGVNKFGDEYFGHVYSPETFLKSDATGAMIRHYVTLGNGAVVHPDELHRATIDASGKVKLPPPKESLTLHHLNPDGTPRLDKDGKPITDRASKFESAVQRASVLSRGYMSNNHNNLVRIESKDGSITLPRGGKDQGPAGAPGPAPSWEDVHRDMHGMNGAERRAAAANSSFKEFLEQHDAAKPA